MKKKNLLEKEYKKAFNYLRDIKNFIYWIIVIFVVALRYFDFL